MANDPRDPTPIERPFIATGDEAARRLPDSEDLLRSLQFSPRDGRITLGDERMLLLHARAFAALRRELIAALGRPGAREVLIHAGYISGFRDARQGRAIRKDASSFELLSAGPQLHALEGMAAVRPLEIRFDRARGTYYGEFMWRNSVEAEAEAESASAGVSPEPACWLLLGYASGYTSGFMDSPVLYRELACRSCGARYCRIVGRPLAAWRELPPGYAFLLDAEAQQAEAEAAPFAAEGEVLARHGLVGRGASFARVWSLMSAVAPTDTPVVIHGEVGTGRSTVASALHRESARPGPLRALGVSRSDLRSIDVAFTEAARGTLVLEDLEAWDDVSAHRVLERLDAATGDARPRIVTTLTRDPEDMPPGTSIRRLLYRVGAFPIALPPLRDRRDDLPALARWFLEREAARLRKPLSGFTPRAQRALLDHDFPGNLHELANMITRAAIVVEPATPIDVGHMFGAELRATALLELEGGQLRSPARETTPERAVDLDVFVDDALRGGVTLDELEAALIRGAVSESAGNLAAAARALGMTRAQLAYRYRKLMDETGR